MLIQGVPKSVDIADTVGAASQRLARLYFTSKMIQDLSNTPQMQLYKLSTKNLMNNQ